VPAVLTATSSSFFFLKAEFIWPVFDWQRDAHYIENS
jgi:hypothetical protein